ncbi:unnamed protein product [Spirodela intermedia]|uniref:Uncharacterized protein n=1 Tax=Spirodela intermedia TaxID=51605 RepID=A0A7I8JGW1_SPIIN|nr:unnamed protein product [Spirodela intermedia]CAA6668773.1 unnamed protein product [Spirodela intermedia]
MECLVEEVVKLFMSHVAKSWSLPSDIVSDLDMRFIDSKRPSSVR